MTFTAQSRGHLAEHNRLLQEVFPVINVAKRGATGDDSSSILQEAIDEAAAAGGGRVVIPAACGIGAAVTMKSSVQLVGVGRGSRLRLVDSAGDIGAMFVLAENAQDCGFINLHIDGNKANQTNVIDGLRITNSGGDGNFLARHRVMGVQIRDTSGVGLALGPFIRQTLIDGVAIHNTEGNGLQCSTFADSMIHAVDIGNSGGHGLAGSMFSIQAQQIKAWFSDGDNFNLSNVRNCQMIGIQSQDAKGNGMVWAPADATYTGCSLEFVSNGDNSAGLGSSGLVLDGVNGARISASVFDRNDSIPQHALVIDGATNNFIDLVHRDTVSTAVSGAAGTNTLRTIDATPPA